MGLMLENISPRLLEPGMPHHGCPGQGPGGPGLDDRAAARRAGALHHRHPRRDRGDNAEIVDSLFALAELAPSHGGHIQEVIVQNFRAKADTRMRRTPSPSRPWFARVVAVARWILGAEMNVQVPPNLTDRFESYLSAGINDWGGVSPLTIDFVNPEAPWPHLDELEARTEQAGFQLCAAPPGLSRLHHRRLDRSRDCTAS
jgi:hypothetical protein